MRVVLIAVASMAIGCGEKAKPPPPPPSAVTVIESGAAPRQVLRYRIERDLHAIAKVELDVTIDAGGQGGVLPTMVLGLETRMEEALPSERARVRTTIVDVSARERPGSLITAAALDAEAHHLRGIAFVGVLAPTGTLDEVTVELGGKKLPPALAAQVDTLAKTFQQVAMPLPPTPVGIGARWRYAKPIEQGGMTMTATTEVQLAAFDGRRLSYALTTALAGPDQTVTQAGTTIQLTNIRGEGKSSGLVDLTRMTMTAEQTLAFRAEMAGDDDQNARMELTVTTRFIEGTAPAAAPAAEMGSADTGADTGSDDNATIEDH